MCLRLLHVLDKKWVHGFPSMYKELLSEPSMKTRTLEIEFCPHLELTILNSEVVAADYCNITFEHVHNNQKHYK